MYPPEGRKSLFFLQFLFLFPRLLRVRSLSHNEITEPGEAAGNRGVVPAQALQYKLFSSQSVWRSAHLSFTEKACSRFPRQALYYRHKTQQNLVLSLLCVQLPKLLTKVLIESSGHCRSIDV